MLIRHLRLGLMLTLVCALFAGTSPGARAQDTDPSRANLQRENDQLRERVAQLEARIKKLERENEGLRQELDRAKAAPVPATPGKPGAPGTVPTTTDVVPLESQAPTACPDALLGALQASYAKAFTGQTITDANKAQYIQDVRKWARGAEREFKGNVEWVIRIDKENLPAAPEDAIPFWVIDPASGKLLHPKAVKAVLARAAASKILENADIPVWDVRGVLGATPIINADRAEQGMLDYPPFIGPFAEFQYTLSIRSAQPHEEKKP